MPRVPANNRGGGILSVGDALQAISEARFTLTVSETGDILKVYPAENISPELAAAIRGHKADIIRIALEDEEMRRSGIIQSERQVFELVREHLGLDKPGGVDLESSEGQVSPFPQQLPIGELITESDAAVVGEAEDIEYHVVHELRGARIPVIHLEKIQLLLEGCCIGRVAGVSVTSIHGPLRSYRSGIVERGHLPGGTFFGSRVAILQAGQPQDKELGAD